MFCCAALADPKQETLYTDATESFPVRYLEGMWSMIMILMCWTESIYKYMCQIIMGAALYLEYMHQALCNLPLQSLTTGSNNHQLEGAHHYIMKKYLTPSPAIFKGQLTTYAQIQHEIIEYQR